MAVAAGEFVTTFISGTASITTSETQHANDLERQTQQTLDNIEALIAADNFRGHGFPSLGATLGDLAIARIYIKRQEDYPQARAICRQRLGELPAIYVVADICRPELLVEIEGIAFSRRHG
jgi:enamine deaminase RidA (YjgF/YER057c/UK114 family)